MPGFKLHDRGFFKLIQEEERSRALDKLSTYQILIVAQCFLSVAFDGFDMGSISFIAPAIRKQWTLSVLQLAPVLGGGLFGLMLGAVRDPGWVQGEP